MIDELLEERAALYVAGVMLPREREQLEFVLEFHEELREFMRGLTETGAAVALATLPEKSVKPSPDLKSRILGMLKDHPQQRIPDGCVVTDPAGLVRWINPAFTMMCGYTLDELRGKKPGGLLQGEKTDRGAAVRMSEAVHEGSPCHEQIVNYRKDGSPYWVDITITPILDDEGRPLWLAAREHELFDRAVA
jgi:PAS domain S-box-containing protein